jgi:hypothetical protein
MMQRGAALVAGLIALGATPTLAAPASYDVAFVSEFADACVPGRLGYQSTQDAAAAAGWSKVETSSHPMLSSLMDASAEAAKDPELKSTFEYTAFSKAIEGKPHFLVVSLTSALIGDDTKPWVLVGCYLYNFDATAQPIANSRAEGGAVSYLWGPPCPMPRTGDTYLTFVAAGGEVAAQVPFTGVALNFSTSVPDPGEVVPATYC